jgi:pyruvate dehydrogenase E2 component (dihydrolipoamide acetyltransferase)
VSKTIDVLVPDIGDFHDVPVIEVLVSPGASIKRDDPIAILESDKASMDVPSPHAGVVERCWSRWATRCRRARGLRRW